MKLTSNLRITTAITFCALALSPVAVFAANPRPHDERGTVKSVDAHTHTLIVTDSKDNSEHKFQWNTQTRFTERGKAAAVSDLKAGERVRITYSGSGDMPTMQRVHIAPAKAEKSGAAKS